MLNKGIIFIKVSHPYDLIYNDVFVLAVKRFTENGKQSIIFIDKKTDGLIFSYTIEKNYSLKNINDFLKLHFNSLP